MLRQQVSPTLSSLSRLSRLSRHISQAPVLRSSSIRLFTTSRLNRSDAVSPTATKPQSRTASPAKPIEVPTPKQPVAMSSSTTNISAPAFLDLIKNRRSYYPLSKDLPISKDRVQEIVKEATRHVPSSFNSQSNRVVVLFGAEHEKLWGIAESILKPIVPEDTWKGTADKLAMFKGAAGTILFFEDEPTVHGMQSKYALYADKFPGWATQSDAMLQFAAWTALEAEGLGANLQHYNPLIDQKVAETWGIPTEWKLNAQLVFGGKTGDAFPKDYKPIEEIYKVFGA